MHISVIIPAYNEEQSIRHVIADIDRDLVSEVIVVDNGSTDRTGEAASASGARIIRENRRGYGYACMAGIEAASQCDIAVFLDGDYSDFPDEISRIVSPILKDDADLVIGSRVRGSAEKGSLTLPQRFGNFLASFLLNLIFRTDYTDLGPFRAVKKKSLMELQMKDKKYGWTVEMQIKAAFLGMKVVEVPVSYRKRHAGKSKVSGTIKGVFLAGIYILYYIMLACFQSILFSNKSSLPGRSDG